MDAAVAGGIISAGALPIAVASNTMAVKIQGTSIIVTAVDSREI